MGCVFVREVPAIRSTAGLPASSSPHRTDADDVAPFRRDDRLLWKLRRDGVTVPPCDWLDDGGAPCVGPMWVWLKMGKRKQRYPSQATAAHTSSTDPSQASADPGQASAAHTSSADPSQASAAHTSSTDPSQASADPGQASAAHTSRADPSQASTAHTSSIVGVELDFNTIGLGFGRTGGRFAEGRTRERLSVQTETWRETTGKPGGLLSVSRTKQVKNGGLASEREGGRGVIICSDRRKRG
ncbi:hypothetical protein DNTS_031673 [Danionella cerebrum]|uniref:Uncharacterized protein n=1 Tax=Danionella cerebrum TaxID=2873325 RepID=A0A553PYJ3_9TELE|nr:hypothetical protein DNTS_031673 [Danionella translucida]